MTRPTVAGIFRDDCTIVISYVARDNAYAGPTMGLIRSTDARVGVRISSNQIWVYVGGANFFTTLTVRQGQRNTIGIVYTPTDVTVTLNAGGAISSDTQVSVQAHEAAAGPWIVGCDGASYVYGSVVQAPVVARAVSATELAAMMAYCHAQPAEAAYPDNRPLITYVGDSITRMTAASYGFGYPFRALEVLRATHPLTENCDTAVGGFGVAGIVTGGANTPYFMAKQFYSATRVKNVMVINIGSNDLANGNPTVFVLNGTGPPGIAGSGIYPLCDAARALGYKVVLMTIGPRTDATAISNGFEAARVIVNNDMAANWAAHADAFFDTRGIVNWGGATDSDNPVYYSGDKIHPINAGHALPAPGLAAVILPFL